MYSQIADFWAQSALETISKKHSDVSPDSNSFIEDKEFIDLLRGCSDEELTNKRENSLAFVKSVAKNEWRKSHKFWATSPSRLISGHLSVSLIERILKKHAYPDMDIIDCLKNGFPLIGETPFTGLWDDAPRPVEDIPDLDQLWNGKRKIGKPTFMSDKLIDHTWSVIQKELEAGWLEPISETEVESRNLNINYMFSIDQSSPELQKFRAVVHYKYINLAARIRERIRLPTHKQFVSEMIYSQSGVDPSIHLESRTEILNELFKAQQAEKTRSKEELLDSYKTSSSTARDDLSLESIFESEFASHLPAPPPKTASSSTSPRKRFIASSFLSRDFKGAYKQLSCRDRSHNVIGAWCPSCRSWKYFLCPYMCFGSLWAVSGWVRVSRCVQFILEREFWFLNRIYIDDLVVTERDSLLKRAGEIIDEVMFCLGFKMASDKAEAGKALRILGLEYQVSASAVSLDLRQTKRQKIVSEISSVMGKIISSRISVKEIQSICGKLNFLLIAARCSGLASALSPLYEVCSKKDSETGVPSFEAQGLLPALEHLKEIALTVPPLKIPSFEWSDNLSHLWTDAPHSDNEARASFVFFHRHKVYAGSISFPQNIIKVLSSRKTKFISILEVAALSIALENVVPLIKASPDGLSNRIIIHTDNTTALFGGLKGTSKDIIIRIFIQQFRLVASSHGINFSLRYVPTKSNISDGGTRKHLFWHWCKALKKLDMPVILMRQLLLTAVQKSTLLVEKHTHPKA